MFLKLYDKQWHKKRDRSFYKLNKNTCRISLQNREGWKKEAGPVQYIVHIDYRKHSSVGRGKILYMWYMFH